MAFAEESDAIEVLKALIRGGAKAWIPSAGLSMGAAFSGVTSVLIRKLDPGEIRAGMIVVYSRRGAWVAHRIIRVLRSGSGPRFRMKGDRITAYDSPDVEASDCIGEVVGIEHNGRRKMFGPWDRLCGRWKAFGGMLRVGVSSHLRARAGRSSVTGWQ